MKKVLPLILVALGMSAKLEAQQIGPNAYIGQGPTAADRAIDNQRYMAEQNARMQQGNQQQPSNQNQNQIQNHIARRKQETTNQIHQANEKEQ